MVSLKVYKGDKIFCLQDEQEEEADLEGLKAIKADLWSMEDEKEIYCIVFFNRISPERIATGCLMSKNAGKYFFEMRTLFEQLVKFYHFDRLEATVRTDFKEGHRMIKHLGFLKIGTMRKFFKNKDYDLYVRYR